MLKHWGVALLLAALMGCKSSKSAATKPVGEDVVLDVPQAEMSEWADAIRLSNGIANLYVVPSVGRVMRFGFSDGENVLWVNPKLAPRFVGDKPETTQPAQPTPKPAWKNFGGDKAWPWPEDAWPLRVGRTWPPPLEVDQMPMRSTLVGGIEVQLESRPIQGYGVKLFRSIAIDPELPVARMTTRFEAASRELPPQELAAWQITQIPADGKIYARLAPVGGIIGLTPAPWEDRHLLAPGIVALDLPEQRAGKMGLDADSLAWAHGETLLVAYSETAEICASQFRPGERAQVFVQSKPDPAKPSTNTPSRYVEFEFTSPRRDLAQGATPELKTTWTLYRKDPAKGEKEAKWTDAEVVKVLTGAR